MIKKVEFFETLFKKLDCRVEILQFLKDDNVISDDQMQHLLNTNHQQHPTKIAGLLEELLQTKKLQLLDYQWTVLPKQLLQLNVVTENDKRTWTYSV